MRGLILIFTIILATVTTVFSQTNRMVEDLKRQVMSGQISPEEAIRRAKSMGLGQEQLNMANQAVGRTDSIAPTGQKTLFVTPDYIEFSEELKMDSVTIENTGREEINWMVNNKTDWINLCVKKGSVVRSLSGKLKPGEVKFVRFMVKIPESEKKKSADGEEGEEDEEEISKFDKEGVSAVMEIKSSTGEVVPVEIVWSPEKKEEDKGPKYFGYDIFKGNYRSKMSDVGPTDNNYIVAPGDELVLNVWGEAELQQQLLVSNDGTVFINNVGQIKLAGETLAALKPKLTQFMSRSFSSLSPKKGNPKTFLDISLAKVTSFPVYVVGNVKKPGMVRVNSMSTAFSALFAAGGVQTDGSLREIEVIRNGKKIGTTDIYDYLTEGTMKSDIRLAPKDVVMVPFRKSTITVTGEINRPMIYELKSGETLADLVRFAGGTKSTTDPSIVVIDRLSPQVGSKVLRKLVTDELGKLEKGKIKVNKLPLFDTDVVMLYPYSGKTTDRVQIAGAVYRAGNYAITDNMNVGQLLKLAGGLKEEAYLAKASLVRTHDDGNNTFFNINLRDSMYMKFKLANRDSLHIYSIWDLKVKKKVIAEGHLPNPGEYGYAKEMRVSDLIIQAGGLEDENFRRNTYLERADLVRYNQDKLTTKVIPLNLRDILAGNSDCDIKLKPDDKLIVYDVKMVTYPKTVSIEGAVNIPGEYDLQTNMMIKDIIVRAGGFTKSAYKSTVEIFRIDPYNVQENRLSSVKKIQIDPGMLLEFQKEDGFVLQDRDIVVVRQHPNYDFQRKVYLGGEVKYPGTYTLLKQKETLRELIERAGGLTNEAYAAAIDYRRDSIRLVADFTKALTGKKKHDVLLSEGDTIVVPKHPGTVEVKGYVNSPGIVQYRDGWTIKDYIEAAGNFTFEAAKGKAVVYYPGGNARKRRWLLPDPKVKEGSVIYVPMRPEREPTDWVELTARIASIVSSVATTVYIIDRN